MYLEWDMKKKNHEIEKQIIGIFLISKMLYRKIKLFDKSKIVVITLIKCITEYSYIYRFADIL